MKYIAVKRHIFLLLNMQFILNTLKRGERCIRGCPAWGCNTCFMLFPLCNKHGKCPCNMYSPSVLLPVVQDIVDKLYGVEIGGVIKIRKRTELTQAPLALTTTKKEGE